MKKSPEPIILAIALVLLAVGAGLMAYMFPTVEDITNVKSTTPIGKMPAKLKTEDVDASVAPWNSPTIWKAPANGHLLFISDSFIFYPSLYPGGNYIQSDNGQAKTPGGVLISWYRKYGLDFTDANIDREDPDGDGFSNKIEYLNEMADIATVDGTKSTNPIDAQSHPSYLSRLRLAKNNVRPFHIRFLGYQQLNGENVFQISLKDVPGTRQPPLKKTGEPLGIEGYTIGPFVKNIVNETDPGTGLTSPVDRSTLELDKPEIGFKIVLILNQETNSPESTADFAMLLPTEKDKTIQVPRGKTFSVPNVTSTDYLLIEVTDDHAVIRDTKTKEDRTVPKLDPKEWDDVPEKAP